MALAAPRPAHAQFPPVGGGGTCTGMINEEGYQGQQTAVNNGLYLCSGGTWVEQPLILGTTAAACSATWQGGIRYTGAAIEYCNGTAWTVLASSSLAIDGLTDAYADYTTLNNLIMGRTSAAALTAGARYNLFIGEGAGATTASSTAATDSNIAVGYQALNALTTGAYNTALGANPLISNTTGNKNVAIGTQALFYNVTKQESTALGFQAMMFADSAAGGAITYNTAVGAYALRGSTTAANNIGTENTAVGHSAMLNNTSGLRNTAVGEFSLSSNTGGGYNTAIGNGAILNNDVGANNTALGYNALFSNVSKSESTAIGFNAMYYAHNSGSAAITYNTAVGAYALQGSTTAANNTGAANTAIGHTALSANTSGGDNVAVGATALSTSTTGDDNIAIGANALQFSTIASYNTAVGDAAGQNISTGSWNTALGSGVMQGVSGNKLTGSDNTGVGVNALLLLRGTAQENTVLGSSAGNSITTGSSNILIGFDVDTPTATTSNHLNIGNTIYGDLSTGNVGIGTASPQSGLHVPDGKYAQFEDNNAGAPPAGDCDANTERGRMSIDTTNNRLYICNGATRGWDYVALTD